ncbi:Transcription factor E2FB [Acorus gramineus]|uniref:Transcription factor E2FB n=1 Tax=Acorus gramineus TaxID=55184 RepID=A0AAV9AEP3_ACOGR|nr:Transcription factor E2FB [Acorus gramineus]
MSRPKELDIHVAQLKGHIEFLYNEECRIEELIRETQENLSNISSDKNNKKWLYVTEREIKNLPSFQNKMLFALKAPRGTNVEVPDPDEDFSQQRFRLVLRSSMGPIDCYLMSDEENCEATNPHRNPTPMDVHVDNSKDGGTTPLPTEVNSGTSPDGGGQVNQKESSGSMSSQDSVTHLVKIVPPEGDESTDYWFTTDSGANMMDMWRIE